MLLGSIVLAALVWRTDLGAPAGVLAFAMLAAGIWIIEQITSPGRTVSQKVTSPARNPLPDYGVVAERLPNPCFIIDRRGHVRVQNSAARGLLGPVQPGQPLSFLLRAPELAEAVQRVAETGHETSVTYFERVPADRWFEARVTPLATAADKAEFLLVYLRDLTEGQRIERMRADFVANASHELRTPLASLSGFIETLQGPARDDDAARERFLNIMGEQARRMSRLIDDLMSLSRIELKAHLRPEEPVELAPLLKHVVDAMHPLAQESGVEISLELPEWPVVVKGDRDELAQIFQNLVHNAIKYGHVGGRVDLIAESRSKSAGPAGTTAISVRDYGPGIAAEHVPRLTERFYRVDVAESRDKGGTGLGLAIVKHIVNRHRGHLTIRSEPGKGAIFTVELESADDRKGPLQSDV